MSKVYVALGSNLGDREAHLLKAAHDIEAITGCNDVISASIYETSPMGPQDQPDYLNSVCTFQCNLEPLELLGELKQIEQQHGRIQLTSRWTARPLDLDILLFGDRQIDTEELTIPHRGIALRSFVLWPLAELHGEQALPGLGSISELKKNCQRFGIRRYQA
ncbi:MAG: 2-amino-4-hydroxy-6-hydroxymethyldihydropteridine diphosphokinase [Granulosicoccus sp.]